MRVLSALLVMALIALTGGCYRAGRVEKGFSGTLEEYRLAVLKNQPKKAYELLDEGMKKQIPYAQFEREWKLNRREMVHEAERMKPEKARIQAVIHLDKKRTATMVAEKPGKWRVHDAPGLRPSPADPEELVRLLVQALERRDLLLYISLLSPAYQKTVMEDIEQKMRQIEKASEKAFGESGTGDVVKIPLDATGSVMLVLRKIDNAWRVDGWESPRQTKPRR